MRDKYMEKIIEVYPEEKYKNNIYVTIDLNNNCNYRCSYCYQLDMVDIKDHITYDHILDFFNDLKQKNPNKKIMVILQGGEPTLYKNLSTLLKELKKIVYYIFIISNGSRSINWWKENSKLFDKICLSYHYEYTDKDHFYNVCKTITNEINSFITINLMMYPEHIEEIYAYGSKLVNEIDHLIINLKLIRFFKPYTKEQIDFIKENIKLKSEYCLDGDDEYFSQKNIILKDINNNIEKVDINNLIISKKNGWNGWQCDAGSFYIKTNGDLFRSNCEIGGPIGNLTTTYELEYDPLICNNEFCNCRNDIYITKRKI